MTRRARGSLGRGRFSWLDDRDLVYFETSTCLCGLVNIQGTSSGVRSFDPPRSVLAWGVGLPGRPLCLAGAAVQCGIAWPELTDRCRGVCWMTDYLVVAD